MPAAHLIPDASVTLVDVRAQAERTADGVLTGALALDAAAVIARLVPGLPTSLTAAGPDADWLLVSGNGATAAAIASRLRERGVRAGHVEGGFRALTLRGEIDDGGPAYHRALAAITAHEA